MKKRAIRANIGDWIYYVSTLSFGEVKDFVSPIDEQLHKSKTLKDLLQRALTTNVESLKNYILNQRERFFNALVLAVYDGTPNWHEVELDFGGDEESFFNLGLLEFSGQEKIFPVDGQHRVEGIKRALASNAELATEEIPVIFIAHKTSDEGMQRSRRLFSTLNRYAKPVSLSDIIALDEDDSIAIVTRELMMDENMPLFADERIITHKQKAIPSNNFTAFTNIISLYECNKELLKYFLEERNNPTRKITNKTISDYCRFRRDEAEIQEYRELCFSFWKSFSEQLPQIAAYLSKSITDEPAKDFRNADGGDLLFRPVGQNPLVKTAIALRRNGEASWDSTMARFSRVNFEISRLPWKNIVWDNMSNSMIRITGKMVTVIEKLIMYLVDETLLSNSEKDILFSEYKNLQRHEDVSTEDIIYEIKNGQPRAE